jgi:hypothetical protein
MTGRSVLCAKHAQAAADPLVPPVRRRKQLTFYRRGTDGLPQQRTARVDVARQGTLARMNLPSLQ